MYKINNDLFLSLLNELYKKNNVIHDHNTRAKYMFRVSLETQTFSTVSARIWNAVIVKFNVNISLSKVKESLKQYLMGVIFIVYHNILRYVVFLFIYFCTFIINCTFPCYYLIIL